MLERVILKNFKCYKSAEIKFSKLTIFCGSNSVGKSTAIQAIGMAFQSEFSESLEISGDLIDLGTFKDIFCRFADDSDDLLSISLHFDLSQRMVMQWSASNTSGHTFNSNSLVAVNFNGDFREKITTNYFIKNGFQFIEAERFGPRSYFNINKKKKSLFWLGTKGQYSYEIFSSIKESKERLPSKDPRNHHKAEDGSTIRRNLNYWMSEITPNFIMDSSVVDEAKISHATFQVSSGKTSPSNMGFGLSYVLSAVLALLVTKPGGIVIIENPEAHLHPRGQSYLGRLIALASLAGVQVIIETHSDHLINGIRVISRTNHTYRKEDFKLHYISSNKIGEGEIKTIDVGEKGELSEWPQGFFDQQSKDLKVIIKGIDD